MFFGISPVFGSANLIFSQITLSAGLSEANATCFLGICVQEVNINTPNRYAIDLFICLIFKAGKNIKLIIN